jgi:glycosyltransferase involved in cell wall biosynthesis
MIRIAKIFDGDYPWDIREEKICRTLVKKGFQVHLICRNIDRRPEDEIVDGLNVHRLGIIGNHKINKLASFPAFFNPLWIKKIIRVIRKQKVDLILVRDLPLTLTAILVGKVFKLPVILDMAENYPAALISYDNPYYKPFLFRNGLIPRLYEKLALSMLDFVFVVCEEQKNRIVGLHYSEERIGIVSNTPDMDYFEKIAKDYEKVNKKNSDEIILLYIGKLDAHRGIDIVIKSLNSLKEMNYNIRLLLVGDGTELYRLRNLSRSLGIQNRVQFKRWQPFEKIPRYIKYSDICLIPHLKSEHTNTTLPNKIFDYMAFNKPIVSSDISPIKRIIDETECGLTFKSGSDKDLTRKIIEVLDNMSCDKRYGSKGKKFIKSKYNWANDSKRLLEAVSRFAVRNTLISKRYRLLIRK